jgi:hypothetical protein
MNLRFDMGDSSCVNKEVNAFNRKLNKIIKPYDHTSKVKFKYAKRTFHQTWNAYEWK